MQRVRELFFKGVFDNKTEKEIYKLARGIAKQDIHATIAEMLQAGELIYVTGGKLRIPFIEGKIQGNRRGFAFFIPENGGQDLFIKQENLCGAVHGDAVLAKRIGGKKGDEGVVVKVLKRNTSTLVGQYFYSKFGGKVIPDDNCYAQDIMIENNDKAAMQGEKVVVKITKQLDDGSLFGTIDRVLGIAGELYVEENALIAQSQLPQEFSKNCIAHAEKVSKEKICTENRLDLRNTLCITIDGDDSRDYDDAISIEKKGDGYLLGVHIADVTHYVKRGDILDIEAYERGTSVYFPDRVLPMLPEQLSNGVCSLNAGEDKYTLSCIMHIDSKGDVIDSKIANTIICSRHRMTYKEVSKIVAGDKGLQEAYADILPLCIDFAKLTELLIVKRKSRGSIDLDIEESQITVQDSKIDIVRYERTFAHRMIEEAMILANETVARFVEQKGLPFVYRIHEKPSTEKAINFSRFLQSLGIYVHFDAEDVQPYDYAKIIDSLQEENIQTVVHKIMLRSMSKARYSHSNHGHFGLASSSYSHFTSPIRRYPDLLIHRIIKHILAGELTAVDTFKNFVEKASMQCSLRERRAEECERNVDELYKVFYMQPYVGQTFQGKISGVTSFAIFVELENSIEGHIKIENLPKDSYTYIEEKFMLKGVKSSYNIGDFIEVQLMRCDIGARKIEFIPLGVDIGKNGTVEKTGNKFYKKRDNKRNSSSKGYGKKFRVGQGGRSDRIDALEYDHKINERYKRQSKGAYTAGSDNSQGTGRKKSKSGKNNKFDKDDSRSRNKANGIEKNGNKDRRQYQKGNSKLVWGSKSRLGRSGVGSAKRGRK